MGVPAEMSPRSRDHPPLALLVDRHESRADAGGRERLTGIDASERNPNTTRNETIDGRRGDNLRLRILLYQPRLKVLQNFSP
jgi:hypothetical protein